ncbi:hypothetical protein [Rubripirellula reticaptiva]|uniref:Uncharacterized protein n=1 Tax=Rubripirellula reticaptiva TaxID=2528013 RepID=A0A5C6EUF3_9BACT|nr:hypothetical protein [Rubripirellula reticaptiva]TWU52024.1 hypothetical protein Poly59_36210 [Rubripirellula reticaptiva]
MFDGRPILILNRLVLSCAVFACSGLSSLAEQPLAAETNESTPLEVTIREHNKKFNDEVTVDEVAMALANWDPTKYTVPDNSKRVLEEASAIFDKVASTRQLLPGSMFYTSVN